MRQYYDSGNEFMLSLCDLVTEKHANYGDQNVIGHWTLSNAEVRIWISEVNGSGKGGLQFRGAMRRQDRAAYGTGPITTSNAIVRRVKWNPLSPLNSRAAL